MPKLLKKLAFSILSGLIFFFSLAPYFTAKAAPANPKPTPTSASSSSSWYSQEFIDWYNKVYDKSNPSEIYGERYTAAQVEWVVYGLFAFILNHISDKETSVACIKGDASACVDAIKQSAQKIQDAIGQKPIETNGQSVASAILTRKGFSGIAYLREKAGNFSLIPEVKAQGFGFGALDPVRDLWSKSRDIAYGLSVLAAVVLAFMIMFRVKISPQVIITVQSAIPKLIGALILVTFSYAIAGLVVDLMYVVIGFLATLLSLGANPEGIYSFMTQGLPVIGTGFFGVSAMYAVMFFWTLLFTLFASGNPIINIAFSGIINILYVILIIIATVVFLFVFIKTIWLLIKTLAQIYLLIIFGPLQIIIGTVTSGFGFGTWLRSLVANLAVYPTVGVLATLAMLFLFYAISLGLGNLLGGQIINMLSQLILGTDIPFPKGTWSPPLTVGESYLPLLFVGVSFVIFTLIPKTADIIKSIIENKPFDYGSAIREYGAVGGAYGIYAAGSLGTNYWPFPFNLMPGIRGREVPRWLKDTADNLKRPLETVGGIARGGGR